MTGVEHESKEGSDKQIITAEEINWHREIKRKIR